MTKKEFETAVMKGTKKAKAKKSALNFWKDQGIDYIGGMR